MSEFLRSGAARTVFSDTSKEAFEGAGPDLRPSVDFQTCAGAETYVFRGLGRIKGFRRQGDLQELKNSGQKPYKVPVMLEQLYASDPTDIFAQDTTNAPQQLMKIGKAYAKAVKRDETQLVIDALNTAKADFESIVHGGVSMTVAKVVTGLKLLRKYDIETAPTLLYTEDEEAAVLQLTQFTSADFAAAMGAAKGEVQNGHYGIGRYVRIGSGRLEAGLPVTAGVRSCFLFVPEAVGLVVGFNGQLRSDITKSEHLWHRTTVYEHAASIVTDVLGCVEIQCSVPA